VTGEGEQGAARSLDASFGRVAEPKSALERAADQALVVLREAPPLALMAVVAGLFELSLTRIAWHGLPDVVDLELLRSVRDIGRFPRNLAAVCGLIALLFALLGFLRLPGFASIGRRLAVAAFSGIFVPSILVATALPYATLRAKLVVFGLAAANVLVTLIGMTAARHRAPLPLRTATGLVAATAFLSLTVVGLGQLVSADPGSLGWVGALISSDPSRNQSALLLLRHLGEACWIGVLVGGTLTVLHGEPAGRDRRYVVGGLFLAATVIGAIVFREEIGHRFRLMVFGAFRLGVFIDALPVLYGVPIGVGLGGGLVGLGSRRPAVRQLAGGLLLWLAAGYAPHTPIQLLYLVLSATLITRSSQAMDPRGEWRDRHPWLRFMSKGSREPA